MTRPRVLVSAFMLMSLFSIAPAGATALTFEERVRAQAAIDEAYYFHQVGERKPFREAMPREIIKRKVESYLSQSAMLEDLWQTPITAEALEHELQRITHNTRFPDRLEEIYATLGRDPTLILECFVRPILVDRLARNFYAADDRVHAETRAEAERLRERLASGRLDWRDPHPLRSVMEYRVGESGAAEETPEPGRLVVGEDEFEVLSAQVPGRVGEIGPVVDTRGAFVIQVALESGPDRLRLASYGIAKRDWSDWWSEARKHYEGRDIGSDVSGVEAIPEAGAATSTVDPSQSWCDLDDTWDNGSLGPRPERRWWHAAVWTGTHMLVWGGDDPRVCLLPEGGKYDPLTDSWEPITAAGAPAPRDLPTAIWTGTEMVVWGGLVGSTVVGTGGRYDPVTGTWRPTSMAGAPSSRYHHSAVWTGDEMIVWGGFDGASWVATGGRYDPASDTWSPTSLGQAPAGRSSHTVVWTGDEMIVWGGQDPSKLNTGGRYDPEADAWQPTQTAGAPAGRTDHTAVWTGDEMIVWGGFNGPAPYLRTGGRYNPATDSWTPTSIVDAPSGRLEHTAVWTGSVMVVWGGYEKLDTGGRYDPVSDTWAPTSKLNAPSGRSNHTAVWTGRQMVVWGGCGWFCDQGFFTGGRYDPVTDTWTPTAATNSALSERVYHSAVWTGSHMIVWGGYAVVDYQSPGPIVSSGGRYDPLTDTWIQTSVSDAPSPRYAHTAVWTGDEMIVWGGLRTKWGKLDDTSFLRSGGRYDPTTDTWRGVSLDEAPSARYFHTAVWTGNRMIIWGGSDLTSRLDTGGRYDPVEDLWTPTSSVDAPLARHGHMAVWSGGEMIVWGGSGAVSPRLSSGGRYDPVSDTWMPTSMTEAPPPINFPVGVWTGGEMIVWGSSGDGGRYAPSSDTWTPMSPGPKFRLQPSAIWSGAVMVVWGETGVLVAGGGRYDPQTDAWTPMSLVNAPDSRAGHSAIWTGSHMIVWGGLVGVLPESTGGRYIIADLRDEDFDGFKVCDADCDDADPSAHPGSTELPGNHIDEDCDGEIQCDPAAAWTNHGEFVSCVATACAERVRNGSLSRSQCRSLLSEAATSTLGRR